MNRYDAAEEERLTHLEFHVNPARGYFGCGCGACRFELAKYETKESTMSEPTPGPWTILPRSKTTKVVAIGTLHDKEVVAFATKGQAQEANARLIAAAPLLLEACEAIVRWYETLNWTERTPVAMARQAIRAAKGDPDAR